MRAAEAVAGALAALAVLSPAGVRADVADFLGRPLASVQIEIEGRPASGRQLLGNLETLVGQPLAMGAVRETIAHLFSLGRFDNIVADAEAVPGGVALRYQLTPVHPVERIVFEGALDRPGVDERGLRTAIAERFGSAPSAGRVTDIAQLVEDRLRARGYLHPGVETRLDVEHAPHRSVLTLVIRPGERTRIGRVDVIGTPGVSAAALLGRLGVATGDPYEPERLSGRVEEYLASRRREGHYQARLTLTARFLDEDRVTDLTVTVAQGPLVRVAYRGDPLPDADRDELVPIAREGSADEDLLEDSTNRIEDYLRARGYRDAAASYLRAPGDTELIITFDVRRGRLYRVAEVEISGNASIPLSEFASGLRVRAGEPFSGAALDADAAALHDLYRRAGFNAVSVQAGLEPMPGAAGTEVPVLVRIQVTENVRTVVGSVRVEGNRSMADADLLAGIGLEPNRPFFATQLAIDRDVLQRRYVDMGFPAATVVGSPGLSPDGSRADVVFTVREGVRVFVDHVIITGNERIALETIERELQFRSGDPLGLAAITESQRRLVALGLFRRTRISQLGHGDETRRDVLITVEEAPATTVGYGGGAEVRQRISRSDAPGRPADERLEFAPRAFFEISRRNLFGKNRSVSLFTRVSLRPRDESAPPDAGQVAPSRSGFGFSEYRILTTFREPRVFGTDADAFLTGTTEQQIRSSFNFARRAFSAEAVRALTRNVSVTGSYQIQRTELFDERFNQAEKLLVDRLFPQVRLSSFSASGLRDTRDDQLNPETGAYLSANAQVAGRRIGSEVGLVKSYLTAQFFRTLPATTGIVLATSARLGLATGFPREVPRRDAAGQPVVDVIRDLPASERFFAGGDTTVRGFALDRLGTPATIDQDGFPIGGNAVVILNAELRAPVRGGLAIVGFLDSGNVFARTGDVNLGQLRSAVGFGFRYNSPVGPIRVDLGFKVNRRDLVPGTPEALTAWHISLGQAF